MARKKGLLMDTARERLDKAQCCTTLKAAIITISQTSTGNFDPFGARSPLLGCDFGNPALCGILDRDDAVTVMPSRALADI